MHAAALNSPRLQRALKVLSNGRPHTTRDLVRKARVMAVNAVISELRHHGAEIICTQQFVDGNRRFFYTMTKAPIQK
ncbi:MAG: hypothetical protein JWS10_963 [Cypionkella sp.]|uniref:helix-turn-helix domain-containing protein n=1 Tax=Cypionkella sp. TaxID=2811411 RepID=UPI0026352B48|nr:helix-turn-helix domain-containing protein [Cypionkella sp.]MDB5658348.1 hypothetical protein [Cypionkella sp.]